MPNTKKTVKRYSSSAKSKSRKAKTFSPSKRFGFSRAQFIFFGLVFAAIGGVLLWHSLASTATILTSSNLDTVRSSSYTIVTETTGSKRNRSVVQLAAASSAEPSVATFYGTGFAPGIYQVCIIARASVATATGGYLVYNYNGGPTGSPLATTIYSAPVSSDYKSISCLSAIQYTSTSGGMEITINNTGPQLRVGSVVVNKTSDIIPPPVCTVNMTNGQSDIDNNPSGTSFCLKGTHNWTLTPKSGDVISGDSTAVLDGGHSTTSAIVATAQNVKLSNIEIRNYVTQGDAFGAITTPDPPSATNWQLVNLNVHDNGNSNNQGAGVELGTGWLVSGGRYWHNVQEGLTAGGGASNDTVNGVELDHNSNHSICGHEGGGFKWVANNITVENSNVHDNLCMGLWADINSTGGLITNNTVTNNDGNGIMWEISRSATITHNTVTGNGFHIQCGAPFGAGIFVADSGDTTQGTQGPIDIGYNTLSGNCAGIALADGDSTGDQGVSGQCVDQSNPNILCGENGRTSVHDNNISNSDKTGYFEDDANNNPKDMPGEGQSEGNSFTNNTVTGGTFCGFSC